MMKLILIYAAAFLSSCLPARDPLVYQACLAQAELEANREADTRCIEADLGWDSCPYRAEIMATLAKNQEACREN